MSVLDMFHRKIVSNAERVVIGFPSGDNMKATGLHYSAEYYAKESVNTSKSDMHKLVAKIANKVLTSDELHEKVRELIDKFAAEELALGYEKSGLEAEDKEQDKNGEKIVAAKPVKKSAAKKAASKASTAKSKK